MINIPHNNNYASLSKPSFSKDNQYCKQFHVTLFMMFIHKLLQYVKA
jgi:hypothetical protein